MNLKLTTFANYSGNSKLAEASKTLKYGDLEIRLINDEYYFVHDNGATIDNISLIKMIGSNFKGLISTFPQSITSDLINYAPSMTLFINSLTDYVKKTELQDGTFDLIVSSVTADGFVSCISLSTTTSASIVQLFHVIHLLFQAMQTFMDYSMGVILQQLVYLHLVHYQ